MWQPKLRPNAAVRESFRGMGHNRFVFLNKRRAPSDLKNVPRVFTSMKTLGTILTRYNK